MNPSMLDDKIINLFDGVTTKIQKKGLLPLNTLKMGNDCVFWAAAGILNVEYQWIRLLLVAMAGIGLAGAFLKWKDAIGYWEDNRKTTRLNTLVLRCRTNTASKIWRIFWLPVLMLYMTVAIMSFDIRFLVNTLAGVGFLYLDCCKFIGPSDYAKDRIVSLSGLPQEG